MRRFYQILSNTTYAFLGWMSVLIALSFSCCAVKEIKEDPFKSWFFIVLQLPLYAIVTFGCYSLISIGWHLFTLGKSTLKLHPYS